MVKAGTLPVCELCQQLFTIEHILVGCGKFGWNKVRYHLDGKNFGSLTNDDSDDDS